MMIYSMPGRATGDQAVIDVWTELSWSCMTCICTPQTRGYKKLLDQASLLPVAALWRPSHDTTLAMYCTCQRLPAAPGERRFGVVGGCADRQRHDKTSVDDDCVGLTLETRTSDVDHDVDRAPPARVRSRIAGYCGVQWEARQGETVWYDAVFPRTRCGTDR